MVDRTRLVLVALFSTVLVASAAGASEKATSSEASAGPPSAPATTKKPAEPAAPPASLEKKAPAKKTARQSGEYLRLQKECYGGRGADLPERVMDRRGAQAGAALQRLDFEGARDRFRSMLRGGANEPRLIPPLIHALQLTKLPEDAEAAKSCSRLMNRYYPGA